MLNCKICKKPYHKSWSHQSIWFDCLHCNKTKEEIDAIIVEKEVKNYKKGEQLSFFDMLGLDADAVIDTGPNLSDTMD